MVIPRLSTWLSLFVLVLALVAATAGQPNVRAGDIDLTHGVVVVPDGLSDPEAKAVQVLVDEVRRRAQVGWDISIRWPTTAVPVIAVAPARLLESFEGLKRQSLPKQAEGKEPGTEKEGFRILSSRAGDAPVVAVIGNDTRGVLFGVGRLVRALRTGRGRVAVADSIDEASAPKYPLRGHQLGYRPKTNSYDAWDLAQWDRYIRELALFGTNAIELIPPRSDDAADSPHFPLPPLEMMAGMSRICADYGLDVWIWYPAMDDDYADPKTVEHAIDEWAEVFRRLPRVDAVFVPGGDPGHTRPKVLLALLEKQAANLRRYHPSAQMWVSPQSFSEEWHVEFVSLVRAEPAWLGGVVYGPQVRVTLAELRKALPAKYPIRDYPDITHSLRCQYPVPDWDVAYSLTEGREVINPRPRDESTIFHATAADTIGFITYSEGCNDDVNKIVWSALGWDPQANLVDVLRQYARCLGGMGPGDDDAFAQGLLALEENWRGPLLTNRGVDTTLHQFRALEGRVAPDVLANWRFQQALYRAYYDAYVRQRLIHETSLEEQALGRLREARALGSLAAMEQAHAILGQAPANPPAADLRTRVFALAEALFQSVRMQLSVPLYKAISVGRGATLDTVDAPLNNHGWLERQFDTIRALDSEADRIKELDKIVEWTNPGPGGFYDDLGDPGGRPHLVKGQSYEHDPSFRRGPMTGFDQEPAWRRSWCRHGATLYEQPLLLHYSGLDPNATYKVRVVYTGDMFQVKVRLTAGDSTEIHPLVQKPRAMTPLEFNIPPAATRTGELDLRWRAEPGRGGNGRGCQVSEVWLLKK